MKVKFTLLRPNARLPERGHDIDVGLDVFTPTSGLLKPGPNKIGLGFSMEVPVGYSASIYPRSGMATGEKTKNMWASSTYNSEIAWIRRDKVYNFYPDGVAILAQIPPIDPGYTGEVTAIIYNGSDLTIEYPLHTRFGQLVIHPIVYVVPCLEIENSRGNKGFGSTGL